MKKTHRILTLPSNHGDVRKCYVFKNQRGEYISYLTEDKSYVPQKMILISDEEIKMGDFVIDLTNDYVHQTTWDFDYVKDDPDYKKILASNSFYACVPDFKESFIEEWCKNPAYEVKVKYKDNKIKVVNNEVFCKIPK